MLLPCVVCALGSDPDMICSEEYQVELLMLDSLRSLSLLKYPLFSFILQKNSIILFLIEQQNFLVYAFMI